MDRAVRRRCVISSNSPDSGQIISLPKGGGALQGIGETFSPDLFTGTGNFTVPIALPAGRMGFQPELSLAYSTGNGNGPFGAGWQLSIPGVSRKTSKGVPLYSEANDTYILSGAEDLVPVSGDIPGTILFRPRTEGLFARIEYHRDSDNSYWQVRSKDGLVSTYGSPNRVGEDPAVISDPANPANVFAWKLTETRDLFGNLIQYDYFRDQGADGEWDQLYLSSIRYVDLNEQTAEGENFLVSVQFDYEDRPDHFSNYRSGFQIRTTLRCKRIEVHTHTDLSRLVKSYQFIYLDQRIPDSSNANGSPIEIDDVMVEPVAPELLPVNGSTLLSQVRITGHDEAQPTLENQTQALPPLEFSYTLFEPEKRNFFPLTGPDMPPASLARPEYEAVDLFGNGLPDVIEMSGVVRYWRNLGQGQYDRPRMMHKAPGGLQLSDSDVQLVDADGDGRADLLVTSNGLSGYYPLQFDGQWDRRSFQRYETAPSFNLKDPEVKLVDLDGDGVTDAIRSGTRLELFYFDPQQGWHRSQQVTRQNLADFPNVNFADPRVKWGDMCGDGLQDIVLVHDGNVEYWPYMGHGNWGKRTHMHNSPRFPYGYDPARILVGDVDGDGLVDIVYVDHCKVLLWINQSGNSWSDPIEIDGTPPLTDVDAVRLNDLLGSGIQGVLWSADASSRDHMYFLDFSGATKPYLLNAMNNHMGAETRVEYAPSTQFYLEDQHLPKTRWQTALPFPVQVVASVEVIDNISRGKLRTEYKYHHGYWDGAEREFRGFGRVDQCDTETFARYNDFGLHGDLHFNAVGEEHFAHQILTKTWFDQGPIGPEHGDWFEADYRQEYWSNDPNAFERSEEIVEPLNGLSRRDRRDAIRTLRGSVLRSELYAVDGTAREEKPYTVSEFFYRVREVEKPPADDPRQRVFFPLLVAQRTTQWERGDDPMTQFVFTADYDPYGQPLRQFSFAVPRGRDYRVPAATSEAYLGMLNITEYAQRDDATHYLVNRVARTSGFEILNDGTQPLFDLREAVLSNSAELALIGHALTYYDGEAFTGLPFGQLGDFGAVTRSEILVLTESLLQEAYRDDDGNPSVPPYLDPVGAILWTEDYPQQFRDRLPALAGYRFHDGNDGLHQRGYYAESGQQYDFHVNPGAARGLTVSNRDPLGSETHIVFDEFSLLPIASTNAAGLVVSAENNYRILQPHTVTDPNGNRTRAAFTPLGLLAQTVVMGKASESLGDTDDVPGSRLIYDLLAFAERQQPVSVTTIVREHHVNDTHVPLPERDDTIRTVEYYDGIGRPLQTRAQAEDLFFGDVVFANNAGLTSDQTEPGGPAVGQLTDSNNPRVIVSGWQIYDNKGQVVEKFEPFFDINYAFVEPGSNQMGQSVRMFYDPRGHVVRTINPDGSEQRVIYGVPLSLDTPEQFTATPWEAYTYDANDLAALSEGPQSDGSIGSLENRAPVHHHFTPTSIRIDGLGRTVESIQRNRNAPDNPGEPLPPIEELRTVSTYDIRGNVLTIRDAMDRPAFLYAYDLANNGLHVQSIDAGLTRSVLDAMGNPIEQRDSKGAATLNAYDKLNRLIRLWARDDFLQTVSLRQHLVHGDSTEAGLNQNEARQRNLLGQPLEHYDEAGRIEVTAYDFKGNLLEKSRQVVSDAAMLTVFEDAAANDWQIPAFQVDWETSANSPIAANADTLLDATSYVTSLVYDALDRVRQIIYPEDVEGQRQILTSSFNRAGELESLKLDGEIFVKHVAYNARGQRILIAYSNGIMSRYAYDQQTFRLNRLRSERYIETSENTYQTSGLPLQEFAYTHDLVGNITSIHDRTPLCGIPNSLSGINALDRIFTYDPLYRLLSASGREHDRLPDIEPWIDTVKTQDATLTRAYIEQNSYDRLGNLEKLIHISGDVRFNRIFTHEIESNQLRSMSVGQRDIDYKYDPSGNMISENASRHFEWNHSNRMKVYRTQTTEAEPSVHAHYFYDAAGMRVKKLVRRQGGAVVASVYVDDYFEHHIAGGVENNSLHVINDQGHVALVRAGVPFSDDATPTVTFHINDHLGSSNIVVDLLGALVNREEYYPFGGTSFGSYAKKPFRHTGKVRDEESKLYYYGARYYAPWTARWTASDPAGPIDSLNLYTFTRNNPIGLRDLDGMTSSDLEDTLKFIVNEAGFEQGAATPPNLDTHSTPDATRFGVSAHNDQLKDAIKRAQELGLPHADQIVEGVRINKKTGVVMEIGVPPKKGSLNFDLVVLRKGEQLSIGDKIQSKAIITGDAKFGKIKTNKAQAAFAKKHNLQHVDLRAGNFKIKISRKIKTKFKAGKGNLIAAIAIGAGIGIYERDAYAGINAFYENINPAVETAAELFNDPTWRSLGRAVINDIFSQTEGWVKIAEDHKRLGLPPPDMFPAGKI